MSMSPVARSLGSGLDGKVRTVFVLGQQSWMLQTREVEAAITQQAGHLAPVRFRIDDRWIEPFAITPWAQEKTDASMSPVLRVMRGDFFCMPFGENEKPYMGERHPPHGQTANGRWILESSSPQRIHLSMRTLARRGRVDKLIQLVPGQTAVYSRHVISEMNGRMSFGHHPTLRVPEGATARVSLSPFCHGQVFPGRLENPAKGGYSLLRPGAKFSSLNRVPQIDGEWADLSVYPAREGYEDLVLMVSDPKLVFAWTALTVPKKRYVWFSLKDPSILPSTVLWMSNGGRHYTPWNGRHRHVIGLEEVLANFHYGLAESAKVNQLNRAGFSTYVQLNAKRPLVVNYIMAVAEIPERFDIVKTIRPCEAGRSVRIISRSGETISVDLDVSFLYERSPCAKG